MMNQSSINRVRHELVEIVIWLLSPPNESRRVHLIISLVRSLSLTVALYSAHGVITKVLEGGSLNPRTGLHCNIIHCVTPGCDLIINEPHI